MVITLPICETMPEAQWPRSAAVERCHVETFAHSMLLGEGDDGANGAKDGGLPRQKLGAKSRASMVRRPLPIINFMD